jgi:alanine dehydrogenase
VEPGVVVIIGAGVVGTNAALIAAGMGAQVFLLDNNVDRLRYLASSVLPKNVVTVFSNEASIRDYVSKADIVVGAVLVPGKASPKLVSLDTLANMKRGSCFVDVAIDQGGMTEVSRATTHDDPVFVVKGVNMYCVPNMPGIVPATATQALSNATIPYVEALATMYLHDACEEFPELTRSLLV